MDRARTFEIGDCLGRGGFGEVYRSTMRTVGGLESDVAVKVLHRDIAPSGQAVRRLRDEGKLLARLDHPVILKVHDLVVLDGRVALVTEFVDGQDLAGLTRGADAMGVRAVLEVVSAVGHALDAAWNAPLRDERPLNLVHRDIKPSNIRIGKHGEVKLLDFGIARTDTLTREARTQTDMMVGTPSYMAPERFSSSHVDPASDVFALASVLYEGLVGRRFYGRMDVPRIAGLVLDPESYTEHFETAVQRVRDRLGDELADLVAMGLVHDVGQRATAEEFANVAERIADSLDGEPLGRWCRSREWPKASADSGEMSGRTITETLAGDPEPEPPPEPELPVPELRIAPLAETMEQAPSVPPTKPTGRGRIGVVVVLAGLGAIGMGVVGLAAGAGVVFNSGMFARPEVVPELDAPVEPPVDEPIDEVPAEAPVPQPEPEPDEPAPAPVERPAPMGRVQVDGSTAVELRSGDRVAAPGAVPVGAWKIYANFGAGMQLAGSVDVQAGSTAVVSCNTLLEKCEETR